MSKILSGVFIALFLVTNSPKAAESSKKSTDIEAQYEENLYSLKDLTGVYVVLDYVTSASLKSHLVVDTNLEQEIKKRLESVGLKLLSKDEMSKTPGNPKLDIYPNYPAHLVSEPANADSKALISNLAATGHCCYTSVWGSFSQSASITRNPKDKYRFATWGKGSNTDSCEKLGEWMSDATLKIIDGFVADYKKSKQAKTKSPNTKTIPTSGELTASAEKSEAVQYVKVKEADDAKGLTCNTAFMVYAQIFKSGSSVIADAKEGLLDKLVSHMQSCKNYRYRIETHADDRGTKDSKDLLSARRAMALQDFLLDKGVDEDQFEMRFANSRKKSVRNSDENVVIVPVE